MFIHCKNEIFAAWITICFVVSNVKSSTTTISETSNASTTTTSSTSTINTFVTSTTIATTTTITTPTITTPTTATLPSSPTTRITTTTIPISSTSATTTTSNSKATAIGIGVGLGGGFLVIAVVIFVVLCCKKFGCKVCNRCCRSTSPYRPGGGQDNDAFNEVIINFPEPTPNPIKISNLLQFLGDRKSNKNAYIEEFKSLPPINPPRIKSCSEAAENAAKNRYVDILPYNEDRVKLEGSSSSPSSSDYINASFIDGYNRKNAFIATQGPLPNTCHDFWAMMWEQNTTIVIMVANLFEDGMPKCAPYFPFQNKMGETSGPLTFNDITISLVSQESCGDYILRILKIQKDDTERLIKQYHYTEWPDKGVPETCSSLLKFHEACLKNNSNVKDPIVTHCSAGVGRTGTLLAIDILLAQAQHEGCIDVKFHVDRMRRRRVAMVQTAEQYMFTYTAVIEKLLTGDVCLSKSEFKKKFLNLEIPNDNGDTNLKMQYELLDALKPVYLPRNFSHGTNPANKTRNRFSKILPVDDFKPYIRIENSDEAEMDEDYINAVFVKGYKKSDRFIVTHMPMESTLKMFWALVKQYNCCAIVMLNDCLPNEKNYWPADGQTCTYGPLTVLNMGEIAGDDVIVSDLKISDLVVKNKNSSMTSASSSESSTSSSSSQPHMPPTDQNIEMEPLTDARISSKRISSDPRAVDVRHIRVKEWPEDVSANEKKMTLLTLVSEVSKCLQRNTDHSVLVHCLNGAGRSGLFCALQNTIDKYVATKELDVFNSVKLIQRSRPEFIDNMNQLKCLYDVVNEYISTSEL